MIVIFLGHLPDEYRQRYLPGLALLLEANLHVFTSGFIVISGYLFGYSRHGQVTQFRPFLLKRILQIYPLYLATYLAILMQELLKGNPVPWKVVPIELTLLQSILFFLPKQDFLMFPIWTASVLILCYALFPWLSKRLDRLGNRQLLLLLLSIWVGYVVADIGFLKLMLAWPRHVLLLDLVQHISFPFRLWEFVAGVALAILVRRNPWLVAWGPAGTVRFLLVLAGFTGVVCLTDAGSHPAITALVPHYREWRCAYLPLLLALTLAASFKPSQGRVTRFLDAAGGASMAFYIVGGAVFTAVFLRVNRYFDLGTVKHGAIAWELERLGGRRVISPSELIFHQYPGPFLLAVEIALLVLLSFQLYWKAVVPVSNWLYLRLTRKYAGRRGAGTSDATVGPVRRT